MFELIQEYAGIIAAVMFLLKNVGEALPNEYGRPVVRGVRFICNLLSINLPQFKKKA